MKSTRDAVTDITTACLIGATRYGADDYQLAGDLADAVIGLGTSDIEEHLLNQATLILLHRRAGNVCSEAVTNTIELSTPETLLPCSNNVADLVSRIAGGENTALLPDALLLLKSSLRRVPFVLLPELLDLAVQNLHIRENLPAIWGSRGAWLAKQSPAWDVLVKEHLSPEEDWESFSRSEREAILSNLRDTDHRKALELLKLKWPDEAASSRSRLISSLKINLSPDDEPFLEAALDDKVAEVRSSAASLLGRLPNSRFALKSLRIAQELLSFNRTLLGGLHPIVRLPDQYEPDWKREGIEERSWIKDVGDRTWWFVQWISRVPPEFWSETHKVNPESLFHAIDGTEWADALRLAWSKSSALSDDTEWTTVILKHWATAKDTRTSISGLMPDINSVSPERANRLLLDLLSSETIPLYDTHSAINNLMKYKGSWNQTLSRSVVDSLRSRSAMPSEATATIYRCIALVKDMAFRVSPLLADELCTGWPEDSPTWLPWRKAYDDFCDVVKLRKQLHEEIH